MASASVLAHLGKAQAYGNCTARQSFWCFVEPHRGVGSHSLRVALPREVPVCDQITEAGADKDVYRKLKPLPPLGSGDGPSRT